MFDFFNVRADDQILSFVCYRNRYFSEHATAQIQAFMHWVDSANMQCWMPMNRSCRHSLRQQWCWSLNSQLCASISGALLFLLLLSLSFEQQWLAWIVVANDVFMSKANLCQPEVGLLTHVFVLSFSFFVLIGEWASERATDQVMDFMPIHATAVCQQQQLR